MLINTNKTRFMPFYLSKIARYWFSDFGKQQTETFILHKIDMIDDSQGDFLLRKTFLSITSCESFEYFRFIFSFHNCKNYLRLFLSLFLQIL